MKHTISALVENEFGVLARIAGLFSGRGYNISSLTVAETLNPSISRMTIVTSGSDAVLEQITKQLNKLVNVIKVQDVTGEKQINRTLALIKVKFAKKNQKGLIKIVQSLHGEILDKNTSSMIIEIRGNSEKLNEALSKLKRFGIIEFAQTGNIAMQKGKQGIE